MNLDRAFVFDVESFPNLFVLVAKPLKPGEERNYLKFIVGDTQDDYNLLLEWLRTKPTLVGFNNLFFDSQLLEKIYKSQKRVSVKELNEFVDEIISRQKEDRFDVPFREWDLSFAHCDTYTISHFDNKRTSLKWLEFSMRSPKMQDLPFAVGSTIPASSVDKVVSYCKNDVDVTSTFFHKCLLMIEHRKELVDQFKNPRVMNMSNASIGVYIVKTALKKAGMTDKQLKSNIKRSSIAVSDYLLPYITFSSSEFSQIHDEYKNTVLHNVDTEGLKGVYDREIHFRGTDYKFGLGGIHAATKSGVYESDEEYVIISADVSSFYAWLAISNRFYPEHLTETFCTIYEGIYNERKKYPKGSAMNKFLKESLVCVYGSSNQKYSFLFDPVYMLRTTVNGQLSLAMLAEALSDFGQILLVNTDGIELRIPRSKLSDFYDICEQWETVTGLKLEYDEYKKIAIRDVNAYWALSASGEIKRKNLFRIYDDFTESGGKDHSYSENPSATVIAEALNAYYAHGTPIEDYIHGENNIYPYLYGVKTQKNFEYLLFKINDERVITDVSTHNERAIRFYVSKSGANLMKSWKDDRKNRLQSVMKNHLVQTAMNIRTPEIQSIRKGKKGEPSTVVVNYDVDKQYYIEKAYKILQDIESGELISENDGYNEEILE